MISLHLLIDFAQEDLILLKRLSGQTRKKKESTYKSFVHIPVVNSLTSLQYSEQSDSSELRTN